MATISVEDLKKLKVSDLKKKLKDQGLHVSGTKDMLVERLQAALTGAPVPTDDGTALPADDNDVDNVEKSIDQLVGDTAPAQPKEPAPAMKVTSKENIPKDDNSGAEKKVVSLTGVSEAERLKARAEKFGGNISDSAKKQVRAERFGVPVHSSGSIGTKSVSTAAPGDMDKLKKRAERFGGVVSNTLSKVDEDERKRKRLERFGPVTSSTTEVKKIKLNSTDSDLEARKKKRAERFGLT